MQSEDHVRTFQQEPNFISTNSDIGQTLRWCSTYRSILLDYKYVRYPADASNDLANTSPACSHATDVNFHSLHQLLIIGLRLIHSRSPGTSALVRQPLSATVL
jgi:hypothetical protein